MTNEDIKIVQENTHLKHFIFDLVRCVDEGTPVVNFFSCGDELLLNAQKHVADAYNKRTFFGGTAVCKFDVGDILVYKNDIYNKYKVCEIVDVILGNCEDDSEMIASGVALQMLHHSKRCIYPISYVNNRFKLAE